jgi:hypothetical protein
MKNGTDIFILEKTLCFVVVEVVVMMFTIVNWSFSFLQDIDCVGCLANQAAHVIFQIFNNHIYPGDVAGADLMMKLRIKIL